MVNLDPYLFFKGECREAMNFYKGIFGGKLDISEYGDNPGPESGGQEMAGKVMHALLSGGDIRLMASDSSGASDKMAKVELSLSGEDESTLRKYWDALAEGGNVRTPLEKAPWGDSFGMLTDKYGTDWMVNITAKKA